MTELRWSGSARRARRWWIAPFPGPVLILTLMFLMGVAMADSTDFSHRSSFPRGQLPRYLCPKVPDAPVLDGKLDDAAWAAAPLIGRFWCAQDGRPAVYQTSTRLCYDSENLYVAFRALDVNIWATMTKRDEHLWEEEVVEFFVSPTGDVRRYFEIEVNPLGIICDLDITNRYTPETGSTGISGDISWDADNLRVAVAVDGKVNDPETKDVSWTVEVAIPFADLDRLTPTPGEVWRCNFLRIDRKSEIGTECSCWSPTFTDPPAFHHPQYFGFLEFGGPVSPKR